MNLEAIADAQGMEVEQRLRWARRSIKGLANLFESTVEERPRRIRKVRELYPYSRVSQWVFDAIYRVTLNLGNWFTSLGLFLKEGYRAFQTSRDGFRREGRYRPPIHVSAKQAHNDLERLLATKRIQWEA